MIDYSPFSFGSADIMFTIMPVIFFIMFFLIFGIIIYTLFKNGAEWHKNNNSPVLSVDAKIVAKRTNVSRNTHHHGNNMHHHTTSSTTYYITFEVESGDRIELHVPDSEYGMLVEGDIGRITFQGTRYKSFERKRTN